MDAMYDETLVGWRDTIAAAGEDWRENIEGDPEELNRWFASQGVPFYEDDDEES